MLETNVAVIGAGMAGLTAAKTLQDNGISVAVFEKARGSGGRLSSKAIAINDEERVTFDLGCTHFTASSDDFKAFLKPLLDGQKAAHWPTEHDYVGLNRNSALTRALADQLTVHFSTRVTKLDRTPNGKWLLWQEEAAPMQGRMLLHKPRR